jgi:CheY-like chemotaxis protein
MEFQFCWEHLNCSRTCRVREEQALFCWRSAIAEGRKLTEECETCSYRQAWVRGEFATADFVKKHERRRQPRSGRRILVVDDEPYILFALEETVRDLQFECIAARDGEDALVVARSARPDLIITDVIMPHLSGYELCAKLKADAATREIPVVMVTVCAAENERGKGAAAGAAAYLTKPFHHTELKEIIDRLLPPLTP